MKNLKFYNSIVKITNSYMKLMYDPIIIGKERIEKEKNYLFAGNHVDWKDPALLIYGLDGGYVNFMAKKELFENKLLKMVMINMGAFPIDRNANDINAVKTAVNMLKKGNNVGIFPEGTRNKELGEFKSGVPRIALMGKCEIVPFGISGNYKHNDELILQFGKPIDFNGINKKEADECLFEEVKSLILK